MDNKLVKLQKRELEIAKEIKRICKKHNIKYTLSSGSALGAIRHGGFIPWDDDMDFAMLREEYNKFLEIAEKELNDKYYIQTMETETNVGTIFAKVRDKYSVVVEEYSKNVSYQKGIWVDIFPYDNASNNFNERKKDYKYIKILNSFLTIKLGYKIINPNFKEKIQIFILKIITKFMSVKMIKNKLNNRMTKHNNIITKNVIFYGGNYKMIKGTLPREFFNEFIDVKFNNTNFPIFKKNIEYLKHVYGYYKKLPPLEKRTNFHGIIKMEIDGELVHTDM